MSRNKKNKTKEPKVVAFEFDGQWFGDVVLPNGDTRTTREGFSDEQSALWAAYDLLSRIAPRAENA